MDMNAELDKYIFDPKNPKGFTAYNLLLKILKDKDNLVIIDPYFIGEIFHNNIFDNEIEDEIWDKPKDYGNLTGYEKAILYEERFTEIEFLEIIEKKLSKDSLKSRAVLFKNLVTGIEDTEDYEGGIHIGFSKQNKFNRNAYSRLLNLRNNVNQESILPSKKKQHENDLRSIKSIYRMNSYIFLIANPKYFPIPSLIDPSKSSVVITTIDLFQTTKDYSPVSNNTRPILLKKISDVNQLLDFLGRELKNIKTEKLKNPEITGFVKSIHIQNFISIKNLSLDIQNKEVYFLGENGDGKTILLQSIVLALVGNKNNGEIINFLKTNPIKEKIKLSAQIIDEDGIEKNMEYLESFKDQKSNDFSNIFAYGVGRFRNDSDKKEEEGYLTIFNQDKYLENPVKWLQYLDYKESKGESDVISLSLAKKILTEILERDIQIQVSPDKVVFTEKGTEVEFHQLSDGYKSVMVWICDLLSRLSEKQPNATGPSDFHGIVLVDEIEAFLHPKWQYSIAKKLREWFPKIQFIFSTHSPIVILGASKDASLFKVYKEEGETKVSERFENFSNLMLNGVLTSPMFGLPTARAASFDKTQDSLDTSDDYISGKIHAEISKRLQEKNNLSEAEIMEMINLELDKFEKAK